MASPQTTVENQDPEWSEIEAFAAANEITINTGADIDLVLERMAGRERIAGYGAQGEPATGADSLNETPCRPLAEIAGGDLGGGVTSPPETKRKPPTVEKWDAATWSHAIVSLAARKTFGRAPR